MDATIEPKQEIPSFDRLNQCFNCSRRGGKYNDVNNHIIGVYLLKDARGYRICNICAQQEGVLIRVRKMNKSQKRQAKRVRLEIQKMTHIPHITLDAKGHQVI